MGRTYSTGLLFDKGTGFFSTDQYSASVLTLLIQAIVSHDPFLGLDWIPIFPPSVFFLGLQEICGNLAWFMSIWCPELATISRKHPPPRSMEWFWKSKSKTMDFHGFSWIFTDFHGFSWIFPCNLRLSYGFSASLRWRDLGSGKQHGSTRQVTCKRSVGARRRRLPKTGVPYPQIIHCHWIFPYKPSIWGSKSSIFIG